MSTKEHEVYRVATELYRQHPDWLTFFHEVLGLEGIVRKAYPDDVAFSAFEQTREYQAIQNMLAELRQRAPAPNPPPLEEPQTVITVRLPQSLHKLLRAEAQDRKVSMNKLCIAKLVQVLEGEMNEANSGKSGDASRDAGGMPPMRKR